MNRFSPPIQMIAITTPTSRWDPHDRGTRAPQLATARPLRLGSTSRYGIEQDSLQAPHAIASERPLAIRAEVSTVRLSLLNCASCCRQT